MTCFKHPVSSILRAGGIAALAVVMAVPGQGQSNAPKPREVSTPLSIVVPQIDLPDQSASQQIKPDLYARPTLDVRIAGQGPFRFLVDTGAQTTVVGRELVGQLGLPPAGRAILVATGSRQAVNLVEVTDLAFADREISLPAIPVLENAHLGADGILGLDSLQGLRVLMDFRERRMTLADPGTDRLNGRYEIVVRARQRLGQMIIMDADVDGIRTAVIIDTGAAIAIGNPALQRRLRAKRRADGISTDVNGVQFTTDLGLANQIRIGTMTVADVQIGFTDSPAFHALRLAERPALILGMNALQTLDRLAIDFAGRKVMFDLPRAATRRGSDWRSPHAF